MKKIFLILCFAVIAITGKLSANKADLFSVDEVQMSDKLSGLSALENFVIDNQGISLSQMENQQNVLLLNLNLEGSPADVFRTSGMAEWNWGSFAAGIGAGVGFCFLTYGLFVYILATSMGY